MFVRPWNWLFYTRRSWTSREHETRVTAHTLAVNFKIRLKWARQHKLDLIILQVKQNKRMNISCCQELNQYHRMAFYKRNIWWWAERGIHFIFQVLAWRSQQVNSTPADDLDFDSSSSSSSSTMSPYHFETAVLYLYGLSSF